MDPLSIAASIANLIELSAGIYEFLLGVKDALSERKELMKEMSWLRRELQRLKDFVEIETDNVEWRRSISEFCEADGPVQQLQHALRQLNLKIRPPKGLAIAGRVLFWKSFKERIKDSLAQIERFKTLIQIALEMDSNRLLMELSEMKRSSDHHEYVGLLKWLSPANYENRLRKNAESRLEDTAQWFLDDPRYLDWVSGGTRTLFCPGDFGTGKSVIAATVVDQLRNKYGPTQPVIYLHCDYRLQSTQGVENFLGDIIRQLLHARGSAPRSVYDMQRQYEVAGSRPPADELEQTIMELLCDCRQVFIVVDALDECDKDVCKGLISFFRHLRRLHVVRLLATSRPIYTVKKLFHMEAEIPVRASEHDIRVYARSRLADFRVQVISESKIAEKIADAVVDSANGAFLLARLHIDCLAGKHALRDLMEALDKLPQGTNDERYSKTYEATMNRIEAQSAEDAMLAKSVLRWVIMAKRPLRLVELQHALAVRPGDTELDPTGLVDAETLLAVCAGLVVVVHETPSLPVFQSALWAKGESEAFVRLIHFSAERYFRDTMLRWFPRGNIDIARTCLTYLSFEEFECGARDDDTEVQELLTRCPVLEYSARYWGEHVKSVETDGTQEDFNDLIETLVPFLRRTKLLDQAEQVRQTTSSWIRSGIRTTGRDAFHALATFNLTKTCQYFLKQQHPGDRRNSSNQTALHVAAISGASDVLEMLIHAGSMDINVRDADRGWPPLLHATVHCNKACVALLLGPGKADVNASSSLDQTSLFRVAETGDLTIAELLLQHPLINVGHKDEYGNTALVIAFQNGQTGVAEMLLSSCELNPSEKMWAQEQMRRLSLKLDRVALYQLLKDAQAYEASWRKRRGWTADLHRGLGTCWFLAQRIWHCPALAPTGGPLCGSLCFCCEWSARCRNYMSEAGPLDAVEGCQDAQKWFGGLIDVLEPWLLRNNGIIQTITPVQYLTFVDYRVGNINCDGCRTVSIKEGYHCTRCHDGNLDICRGCVDAGLWCSDESHGLLLYRAAGSDESIQLMQKDSACDIVEEALAIE